MKLRFMVCGAILVTSICTFHGWAQSTSTASAVVTVYAGGNLFKALLPSSKGEVFTGCIFDGERMLGCINHLGFITVRMTPGPHTLSASLSSRHPARNSQLELTLETGRNYFMRAEEESVAFKNVVGSRKGRLESVTCEVAHADTQKSHPMEEKQLGPAYKGLSEPDMPDCAATP